MRQNRHGMRMKKSRRQHHEEKRKLDSKVENKVR